MRLRFVAGALALALFGSPPAFACFDVDSPPSAAIHFVNSTTVELTVTGLVVKALGRERAEVERLRDKAQQLRVERTAAGFVRAGFEPALREAARNGEVMLVGLDRLYQP